MNLANFLNNRFLMELLFQNFFLYGVDVINDIKFIIKIIMKSVKSLNLNEIVL